MASLPVVFTQMIHGVNKDDDHEQPQQQQQKSNSTRAWEETAAATDAAIPNTAAATGSSAATAITNDEVEIEVEESSGPTADDSTMCTFDKVWWSDSPEEAYLHHMIQNERRNHNINNEDDEHQPDTSRRNHDRSNNTNSNSQTVFVHNDSTTSSVGSSITEGMEVPIGTEERNHAEEEEDGYGDIEDGSGRSPPKLENDDDDDNVAAPASPPKIKDSRSAASKLIKQTKKKKQKKNTTTGSRNSSSSSSSSGGKTDDEHWWVKAGRTLSSSFEMVGGRTKQQQRTRSKTNSTSLYIPSLTEPKPETSTTTRNENEEDDHNSRTTPEEAILLPVIEVPLTVVTTPSRSKYHADVRSKDGSSTSKTNQPGTPETVIIQYGNPLGFGEHNDHNDHNDVRNMDDGDNEANDAYNSDSFSYSNSSDSSSRHHIFGFLKRAANDNKLYRRLVAGAIALLILFVILVIIAIVWLGQSRSSPPPSSSSSSSPTRPTPVPQNDGALTRPPFVRPDTAYTRPLAPILPDDTGFDVSQLFGDGAEDDENDYDDDTIASWSSSAVVDAIIFDKNTGDEEETFSPSERDEEEDDDEEEYDNGEATIITDIGAMNTEGLGFSLEKSENGTLVEAAEIMLLKMIEAKLPDTVIALTSDPTSPQYRAYEWAVTIDPLTETELSINPIRMVQRYVLAVLYYTTNGNGWTDWTESSGWLEDHDECSWYTTSPTSMCDQMGRIYDIDLRKNNLAGRLPSEFVLLSDTLSYIRLNGNKLIGSIPSILFDGMNGSPFLGKLLRFHVHWNSLTGTLPTFPGTNIDSGLPAIKSLRLGHNDFVGTIPWQLSELSTLQWLDLAANDLVGSIPFLLGDLTALTDLDVSDNKLYGSIPNEITQLTVLKTLELDTNNFTGGMPAGVCGGDLPYLETLNVDCADFLGCSCCSGCTPLFPSAGALTTTTTTTTP